MSRQNGNTTTTKGRRCTLDIPGLGLVDGRSREGRLYGRAVADLASDLGGESRIAWRALLAGFDGLPLDDTEVETFRSLTGLAEPSGPYSELWAIAGRRGGKSIAAALIAVMAAVLFDRSSPRTAGYF